MISKSPSALRLTRPAAVTFLVVIGLLTIPSVTSRAVEGVASPPAIRANLANPPAPRGEFVDGEILVAFKPGAAAAAVEAARQGVNASRVKTFASIGVQHWRLPDGLDVARAVQALSANPNVRYAEPNFIYHAADFPVPPNDPRRGDLWGMHNVGQTGGTIDADIDAMEAWQIAQGSTEVVVAIIDTGIDYNHPDLARLENRFRRSRGKTICGTRRRGARMTPITVPSRVGITELMLKAPTILAPATGAGSSRLHLRFQPAVALSCK